MANKSGKINLDITSILFALLENLASIDFDLKFFLMKYKKNKKELLLLRKPIKNLVIFVIVG